MANYFIDYGYGYAGRRPMGWKPKGVVIHNTAGKGDSALYYLNEFIPNRVRNGQMNLGYTHYYIDRFNVVQVADTRDGAWHTSNADGNMNYVGYEVCESYGNEKDFLANEQATFKQVAEDMKFWGLEPNRDTVRLHREFFATACPHRSWELHGRDVNKVKDYFISQIKKYMGGRKDRLEAQAHVQNKGWLAKVGENEVVGTTGKSLRLEALKIDTKGKKLDVQVHIQNIGWKTFKNVKPNDVIGTVGKGLRIEAITFIPKGWRLKARVHIEGIGWTATKECTAKQGFGTTGQGRRIEAVEFEVID